MSRLARIAGPWLLLALALSVSLPRIGDLHQGFDEDYWIWEGQEYWRAFKAGALDDAFWSQPQEAFGYRTTAPGVSKLVFGIALELHGMGRAVPHEPGRAHGTMALPREVLAAARRGSAVIGSLGVAFTFLLAQRLFGTSVAYVSGLLLATCPVWLAGCRRATTDDHGATFAVGALWLFLRAREGLREGRGWARPLIEFALTGLLCGLAVGSKFNVAAVPLVLGGVLGVDAVRSVAKGRVPARELACGAMLAAVAIGVFVGTYPYLAEPSLSHLHDVLRQWRDFRQSQVLEGIRGEGGTYWPGWHGFVEMVTVLCLPGRASCFALLLPASFAFLLRWRGRATARNAVIVFVALLPAALTMIVSPGRIVQLWIGWVGLAAGALALVLGPRTRLGDRDGAVAVVALTNVLAAASIVGATVVTWARFYTPILPALMIFAALGLEKLRRSVRDFGGRAAAGCIVAALVVGCCVVLTTYPEVIDARGERSLITPTFVDPHPSLRLRAQRALAGAQSARVRPTLFAAAALTTGLALAAGGPRRRRAG